jgi:hypothetical protein
MKSLYTAIVFLIIAIPVVDSCVPSPVGPSHPSLSGCEATIPANFNYWPCGGVNGGLKQVVIRNRTDYIRLLCLDTSKPIPDPPCDFSAYMLVGEPLTGGCQMPRMSYPTVCYYPDKVVLMEHLDYPVVTPGGPNCNSIWMNEAYLVVPKSDLPFSVSTVAGTL